MPTFIALLRGINVGGHNKVPMAELRSLLEGAGLKEVRTYIQSGNVIFRSDLKSPALESRIGDAIEKSFGFRPAILVITAAELRNAAKDYPFPIDNHKFSHFMFLAGQPGKEAIRNLKKLDPEPDRISLGRNVVYFYFPNGVFGAKIDLTKIEKLIGVNCTSRNWRTVQKLIELSS